MWICLGWRTQRPGGLGPSAAPDARARSAALGALRQVDRITWIVLGVGNCWPQPRASSTRATTARWRDQAAAGSSQNADFAAAVIGGDEASKGPRHLFGARSVLTLQLIGQY